MEHDALLSVSSGTARAIRDVSGYGF